MGFVIPEISPADRGVVGLDPTGCASPGRQGDELGEDQVSRDGTWRGKRFVFKSAPTNGCSVGLQSAGLDISSRDRLQRQSRRRRGSAAVIVSPAVGRAVGFHPAGVHASNADGYELRVHAGFGGYGPLRRRRCRLGRGGGWRLRWGRRRRGRLRVRSGGRGRNRLDRRRGGLAGQVHQRQKQQKRESDDFGVTYAGKRRFTFYGM